MKIKYLEIIHYYSLGYSYSKISKLVGLSKSGVHGIVKRMIANGVIFSRDEVSVASLHTKKDNECFTDFSGWVMTTTREYYNENTKELIRLIYIPSEKCTSAEDSEDFGYFIKI